MMDVNERRNIERKQKVNLFASWSSFHHDKIPIQNFFHNIVIVHHADRKHKENDFVEYHINSSEVDLFLTYTFRVALLDFSDLNTQ